MDRASCWVGGSLGDDALALNAADHRLAQDVAKVRVLPRDELKRQAHRRDAVHTQAGPELRTGGVDQMTYTKTSSAEGAQLDLYSPARSLDRILAVTCVCKLMYAVLTNASIFPLLSY
jgi:hypothetical protein